LAGDAFAPSVLATPDSRPQHAEAVREFFPRRILDKFTVVWQVSLDWEIVNGAE